MGTRNRRFRWLLLGLMLTNALVGLVILYVYIHGSLEMFPTDDDHSKVQEVSLMLLAGVAIIELLLFILLGRIRKIKN